MEALKKLNCDHIRDLSPFLTSVEQDSGFVIVLTVRPDKPSFPSHLQTVMLNMVKVVWPIFAGTPTTDYS